MNSDKHNWQLLPLKIYTLHYYYSTNASAYTLTSHATHKQRVQ